MTPESASAEFELNSPTELPRRRLPSAGAVTEPVGEVDVDDPREAGGGRVLVAGVVARAHLQRVRAVAEGGGERQRRRSRRPSRHRPG